MVLNEDCSNAFDDIYHLILKSYADKYLIQSFDNYKKPLQKENLRSFYVIAHLCELCKSDMALNLWKIYCDNNPNATNIRRLNSLLHKEQIDVRVKINLAKDYKVLLDSLKTFRNEFLAHNDLTKSDTEIEIEKLFDLLDEISGIYNNLCESVNSPQAKKITDKDIINIGMNSIFGSLPFVNNLNK